jgi:cell division protease FtsH
MDRKAQIHFWYAALAMTAVLLFQYWLAVGQVRTVPYSELVALARDQKLAAVTITETGVHGELRQPEPDGVRFVHARRVDPQLAEEFSRYGVAVTGATERNWLTDLMSWLGPTVVFVLIWLFVIRKVAERQGMGMGGLMSVGKSKAKVYVEKDTKVTFKDVAGIDEAKHELEEVVSFLKNPKQHGRLGARMPKGVLLVGPPGTGKTLLARAVAGEAGVPFFSINGSEFVEMFVGVGAARVRDLFEQARASAPCIIFIDELDALGRARGFGPLGGGHDEKEQTLNQLLSEMDGFDPRQGVVLLAATNRPEILDPALLRAGRFDRQVLVDRPDKAGRLAILKIHTARIRLAADVALEQIAALTVGFSGADLANLANEAALVATRRGGETVTTADFTAAFERIVAGLEKKNRVLNAREREVVAYHEMGHALLALALPGVETVHKVSIVPRGIGALGYTMQRPTEERYLMDRSELENKMCVLLGGRAAERVAFDTISTGAADDLGKVTDIARSIVMQYGMDEKLGHVVYEPKRLRFLDTQLDASPRQYSEETAREIDCAVRALVEAAFARAVAILTANRAVLERGAKLLLERETLSDAELAPLKAALKPAPVPAAA